tara:strand:- start:30 stop:512 length:483 start_codon:yes stop_codon:yes gene_type:complete
MNTKNMNRKQQSNTLGQETPLVIYDGSCGLCQTSVQFILKYEMNNKGLEEALIRFVPDDNFANEFQTIGFLYQDKIFTKSSAAIEISKHLRYPWKALKWSWIIPKNLRDKVYEYVAQNRHRWKPIPHCNLPNNHNSSRFIAKVPDNLKSRLTTVLNKGKN